MLVVSVRSEVLGNIGFDYLVNVCLLDGILSQWFLRVVCFVERCQGWLALLHLQAEGHGCVRWDLEALEVGILRGSSVDIVRRTEYLHLLSCMHEVD